MPRKLFKSLKVGEHFGLNQYSEASLVRIKQLPGKGSVPFFNAKDNKGQLVYVPIRRYIFSANSKGKRK